MPYDVNVIHLDYIQFIHISYHPMPNCFLEDSPHPPAVRFSVDIPTNSEPTRESVRLLAIGSRQAVLHAIHRLHRLKFAEAGDWSPLLPGPNPGEVMSILTLNFWLD
jgi:hypothetical protein